MDKNMLTIDVNT